MQLTWHSAIHFATDIAWKATFLFAVTSLLLVALRRASAASRHLVGVLGLGAALLLPLLSLSPARIHLPLLKGGDPIPFASTSGGAALMLGAWLLGALAIAARLLVGWLRVRRIARAARPIHDTDWVEERDALALRLEVQRPVELMESVSVPVAMTAGLLRPLLLIGRAARLWAVERRRVVLLHELAHIKRRDWAAVLICELSIALYWFHPLAWWIGHRVRRDAERASDDLVISAGIKPSVYAGHLLGIFRSMASPAHPVAPALAAVRPSHFEERLRAILDPSAHRLWQPAGGSGWAAAGMLAAAVGVAVVDPSASSSARCAHVRPSACPAAARTAASMAPASIVPAAIPAGGELRDAASRDDAPRPAIDGDSQDGLDGEDAVVHAIRTEEAMPAEGFVQASNGSRRRGADWYGRGQRFHRDARYPEAIEAFENAIAAGYREDASSYNIACGYALMGNADSAFHWLARARDAGFDLAAYVGPDDDLDGLRSDARWAELKQWARAEKADLHSGETRAVVSRYERLAARAPQSGEPFFDAGRELLKVERYDLASKAFEASAQRGYRVGTSLYNQACASSLSGDRPAALDHLAAALDAGFDQPDLFQTDDDLDSVRDDPRFVALSREARDLSLPGYRRGRWLSRRSRSEWGESTRRYEDYAKANPGKGRAWFNLGFAALAAERPEAAAEAFRKALDLGYRKPTTVYNLACAYARLDRKDEAFDWLFRSLKAGFDETGTLRSDDDLDNLRADPRYRKALEISRALDRGGESD